MGGNFFLFDIRGVDIKGQFFYPICDLMPSDLMQSRAHKKDLLEGVFFHYGQF